MLSITGLTIKQAALLEKLWHIDTYDEALRMMSTMNQRDRLECQSLMELVVLSEIDNNVFIMDKFPEVDKILKKVK